MDYVDPSAPLEERAVVVGWAPLLLGWLEAAVAAELPEPNAIVLATVDAESRPSTRTVLCRGLSEEGIRWFTNYDSAKGRDLEARPYASATFLWIGAHRQVHLRGPVHKLTVAQVQQYWDERPRGAQVAAWASAQSQPIASRAALEQQFAETEAKFEGVESIPVPDHWGGYRLAPERVEFWQGGRDRLHRRIRLTAHDGGWGVQHIQP